MWHAWPTPPPPLPQPRGAPDARAWYHGGSCHSDNSPTSWRRSPATSPCVHVRNVFLMQEALGMRRTYIPSRTPECTTTKSAGDRQTPPEPSHQTREPTACRWAAAGAVVARRGAGCWPSSPRRPYDADQPSPRPPSPHTTVSVFRVPPWRDLVPCGVQRYCNFHNKFNAHVH